MTGLPLLAAQAEVWLDEQLSEAKLAYAMADYLDILGDFEVERFREAVRLLAGEAECLRARFVIGDGQGRQIIDPLDGVPLDTVDVSAEPDPVDTALRLMAIELDQPFDLGAVPLFFLRVYRVGARHHLVLWKLHHLLSDGFSRGLLYPRLAELYRGEVSGRPLAPLQTLISAEERYLESAERAADREHWAELLSTTPPPGTWSDRDGARGLRHLRRSTVLSTATTAGLRQLAASAGTTLSTVAVAAASLYTHRITGLDDFTLTLPVTGRVSRALRGTPGMTANYLPLLQRVRTGDTVGELFRGAWRASLDTLRHQRYRGAWIRRDLALPQRNRSFGLLANVLPAEPVVDLGGDCTARLVNLSTGITDDVIVTYLESADGRLMLHLNANPDVYPAEEVERHHARLVALLTRLPAVNLHDRVAAVDVLAPGERRLLAGWNATERATTSEGVVQHVYRWAAESLAAGAPAGDRIAVQDDAQSLTYPQLATLVRRAGRRLVGRGIGADDVVGVLARPGVPLVTAILGILAAGAAWTPCEVDDPVSRSAGKLVDGGARLLLAGPGCGEPARAVAGACPEPLDVVELDDLLAADPAGDPPWQGPGAAPQSLAYVLFTSGSTGRPKGAMVHRGGMLNHLHAKIEELELGPADCVVHNAPVTFDVSIWQMLAALLAGGRVRAVSRQTAADPDALFGTVAADGVTVLEVVPSLLRAALDVWEATGEPPPLHGLRRLVVTGEVLPADLCDRWFRIAPRIPLVNAYGPTECSDDVTHAVLTARWWAAERERRLAAGGRVPIGHAVRNTLLYVLDDQLSPVGIGVPGELYVGGAGVGRGYVADPRRTATAFVADPFGPRSGARMYRTGDRVVREPDGQVVFIERVDHQVKIRGHRVELGEVEAALRSAPGVRDAAAAVVRSSAARSAAAAARTGESRLVGYLVPPAGGAPLDLERVHAHVRDRLPAYMWPARLLALPELPLTANGKVDRAHLPHPAAVPAPRAGEPSAQAAEPAAALSLDAVQPGAAADPGVVSSPPVVEPGTPPRAADTVQELILAVIAQGVGLPEVGPDEDFFAVGGDSISALRVVSGARRAGLTITPRDVYQYRTARALAAHAQLAPAPAVGDDDGVGELVLTPIMHELRLTAGPVGQYAQYVVLDGPDGLDLPSLRTAVQQLLDHHDALRMRLTVAADGGWTLSVRPAGSVPVENVVSLSQPDADLDRCVEQALSRLDPERAVMAQVVLVPMGSGAPAVVIVVHHLAVDGVSWRVLIDDLAAVWPAPAAGHRPSLDPVGTSFRGWTRRLARDAVSARRLGELALWQETIAGPERLACAGGLDAARDTYGRAGRLRVELPCEQTAVLLTDAVRAFGVEINDVLLTALLMAFLGDGTLAAGALPGPDDARPDGTLPGGDEPRTGRADMLLELEGHGREYIADGLDLTRTVGWFTSVFPVRLDLGPVPLDRVWAGGPALAAAVRSVRDTLRRLPDHGLGYGLLRHLNPRTAAQLTYREGPRVGFNYLGRFDTEQAGVWRNHPGTPVVGTATASDRPLNHVLEITPVTEDRPDGPHLVTDWLWAGDLLPAERVAALADGWLRALTALASAAAQAPDPSADAVARASAWPLAPAPGEALPVGPLQQGLMFLTEFHEGQQDPYTLQLVVEIAGELATDLLRHAADLLLRRHPQLGAAFHYLQRGEAVQVIPPAPALAWSEHDLSRPASTADSARGDAEKIIEHARTQRFVLSRPPLLRLDLICLVPDRHLLVLTAHHIVIDGWSIPILLRDLIMLYRGEDLPPAQPYRRYLDWLAGQDRAAALAGWSAELRGLAGPTLVREVDPSRAVSGDRRLTGHLDAAGAAELTAFSRASGLTPGVVLQGCWALLLAELTGRDDVVFGSVVAGRPPEVPGIESMVGMFLNTVPVRVALAPGRGLAGVLRAVHDQQIRVQPHTHLPLGDVFAAMRMGELFDTVVVIENFPMETVADAWADAGLRVRPLRFDDSRHYPLSLVAELRDGLAVHLDYLPQVFDDAEVRQLVDRYLELVLAAVRTPTASVAQVLRWSPRPAAPVPPAPGRAGGNAPAAAHPADPRREQVLCAAFAEALDLPGVDPSADFFALGGDSISAIRLVARARARGIAVPLRAVFLGRTARALAADARWVNVAPGAGSAPADDPDEVLVAIDDDELDELDPVRGGGR